MQLVKEADLDLVSQPPRSNRGCARIGCLTAVMLMLSGCELIILLLVIDLGKTYVMRIYPRYFTQPLPLETVQYLCNLLALPNSDPRCQHDQTYAHEFFPQIRQRYPRWTDAGLVDAEIGRFLLACDDPIESFSNGIFRTCEYDLAGDVKYLISIKYSGGPADPDAFTGVVWNTCTYAMQTKAVFVNFACNPPLAK